jgi:hypothetical protein
MRTHVQPGNAASVTPGRFVSKHWGWLRALLIACLLFAVGATETEDIRFQSRQNRRTGRVRQWRHGHTGRGHLGGLRQEATLIEASEGTSWKGVADDAEANAHKSSSSSFSWLAPAHFSLAAPSATAIPTHSLAPRVTPFRLTGCRAGRAPPRLFS